MPVFILSFTQTFLTQQLPDCSSALFAFSDSQSLSVILHVACDLLHLLIVRRRLHQVPPLACWLQIGRVVLGSSRMHNPRAASLLLSCRR